MLVLSRSAGVGTSDPGPALLSALVDGFGAGRATVGGVALVGTSFRGVSGHPDAHGVVFTPNGLTVVSGQQVVGQSGYLFAPVHGPWTVGGQMARLEGGGSNPSAAVDAGVKSVVTALRRGGIDPGYVQSLIVVSGELSGVAQPETERGLGVVVTTTDPADAAPAIVRATAQVAGGLAQLWTSADLVAALRVLDPDAPSVPTEMITNEGFPYSPYVLRPTSLDDLAFPGDDDLSVPATAALSGGAVRSAGERPSSSDPSTVPGMALLRDVGLPAGGAPPGGPATLAARHAVGEPVVPLADPEPTGGRSPARWIVAVAVLVVIGLGIFFGARALFGGVSTGDDASGGGPTAGASSAGGASSSAGPAPQTVGAFTFTFGAGHSDANCAAHARGKVQEFLAANKCASLKRALYLTTAGGRQIVVSVAVLTMSTPDAAVGLKQTLDSDGTGNVNTMLAEGTYPAGYPTSDLFAPGQAYASAQDAATVRVVEAAWVDGAKSADGDPSEQAADSGLQLKVP